MSKMVICYHGTTKKNAMSILKNGFNPYTYFSEHLEDALGYGGSHVFEVAFTKSDIPDNWQFTYAQKIDPENIVALKFYKRKIVTQNKKLRSEVFESQLN